MSVIPDAKVIIDGREYLTNDNGVCSLIAEEGTYDWIISKDGYITKRGTVAVNIDKTVNVELPIVPPYISSGIITIPTIIISAIMGGIYYLFGGKK